MSKNSQINQCKVTSPPAQTEDLKQLLETPMEKKLHSTLLAEEGFPRLPSDSR